MTEPIVAIDEIRRRARAAALKGDSECPFNWHSAAFRTWTDEYRRAREEAAQEKTTS